MTRIVPFETVDAVLEQCGPLWQRLRKPSARVAVYLLLAATLFAECDCLAVWSKLIGTLGSPATPKVTDTGLWHAPPSGSGSACCRPLSAYSPMRPGPYV
ncbi:transposase domain-containing protein [Streptomyces sp. NPDC091215]|uniref:transposase domain-containing protein n=1 Tax=Streptomyces sp. NPDC091215 TaxID=3155192 RepID=UPI003418E4C5